MSPSSLPQIIAHRGASADAPENTLAAFRLAFEHGADAIEGDFHLCRDGHIVCHHDVDTFRTAGLKRAIADQTLAELRRLDVGVWKSPAFAGQRVATLGEVLAIVPPGKGAVLELKSGVEIVPAFLEVLDQTIIPASRVRVISFHRDVVRAVKAARPSLDVCWLTEFEPAPTGWRPSEGELMASLQALCVDGVGFEAQPAAVSAAMIERLRAGGFASHVWTVDDPGQARVFWRLGVKSITTNQPKRIRASLAAIADDDDADDPAD
ncbi:MAG: glycerophosphodiester phosphodiesterase [Tepidisphaeraceae bacterium]